MPVALYRVTDAHGRTVREYVEGAVKNGPAWERALRHAAKIDGKVFHIDHDGYLTLVFGERAA